MTFNFLRSQISGHIELSRVAWFLSVLAGLAYAGAHLYINHQFSIIEFGTGMGLLNAGSGGATALKDTAVARSVGVGQ